MRRLPAKTADAIDLAIEFSTLGEYGLEYPDTRPSTGATLPCQERDRALPAAPDRTDRRRPTTCSSETTDFASALRPPRIRLSFTD